jgi:hypothetical protein
MWILLFFLVIFFLAAILGALDEKFNFSDKMLTFLSRGLILLSVASITLGIIFSVKVSNLEEVRSVESSEEIYSVNSELGVTGSFFLGCGSIEGEIYYVVLMKNDLGYYQEVFKGDIYIVETDDMAPAIQRINYYRGTNEGLSVVFNFKRVTKPHYIIYVPVGTVVINYTI